MKTKTILPADMELHIARYNDLTPNKSRTAANIPPEAREMMTARETKTVIAYEGAKDTPWGDGPIAGPKSFAVVIAECGPGNGPGLHVHQDTTETFTCIKGKFCIEWGDKGEYSTELNLFDTISVPPGVMRRFHNISKESGLLYVILQGGDKNLRDVEFPPSMVEELSSKFGDNVVNELKGVGYSFQAGLD